MLSYMQMSEAMHVLDLHLTASPNSPLHSIRSPETNMTVSETLDEFSRFHAETMMWVKCVFDCWPDKENRCDKVPHGYFTLDDGFRARIDGEREEGPLLYDVLKEIAKITLMMGGRVP